MNLKSFVILPGLSKLFMHHLDFRSDFTTG
jgi:hypothetical protein